MQFGRPIEIEPEDWGHYYSRSIVYDLMGEDALSEADEKKSEELSRRKKN